MTHDFHGPYKGRRLPVTLRPKTVSVSHQALHRNSWKLREAMQILKRIGKCIRAAFFQEMPQTQFNSCRLTHGLTPRSAGPQRLRNCVSFIVISGELLDFGVSYLVNPLN